MSELGDSVIKLFGKTIALPLGDANDCVAASDHNLCSASDSDTPAQELDPDQDNSIDQQLSKEPWKDEQEDGTSDQISEKVKDTKTSASSNDNPKTPSADVETSLPKNGGEEEDKTESETQDKTLKKPDKILPCPRCNSMDTKFCYYNNYNVNQPRHFCKNCQRYWTAGGTMRNVPVGAGRRKNKNATASHYRHIMVSEALQMARINAASNGNVLTFGSDSPLCDNMASVLNLAEKSQHRVQNGFHRDNGDDHSSGCGSSITGSNSSEKVGNSGLQEANVKNYQAFPPQVPCFPGPPWPCAWNSVQWNPAMHPAAYPMSFYPAPTYWGCTVPGSWNMPLPSPDNSATNSTPNSMVLGKHSRDGNILNPIPSSSEKEEPVKESNSGRSVWIPKTLRIDDPGEAAKSSIWATLGIRNEKTSSISGRGMFKSFTSDNDKAQAMGASAALHANPAALSRSLNFQENT